MSQNQGDVQLKNENDKKKAKSTMTWHRVECDGSLKKQFEGVGVQSFQIEEERKDLLFWSSTKSMCPRDYQGQPN